jgi:NADH-quinone oxidoreductase subunit H
MLDYMRSYLGSTVTPGEAGNQVWALIYIFLIFAGVSVAVMAMNWLERKALAHMQVRLGPMRVGPHGLLQPIADALKLLLKEDIMPDKSDKFVFWIAPIIGLLSAFTVYIVVPFGQSQAVTDMNIGVLFMLGVSSLSVLGVVMAGWASNSNYPLIGALRSSAQMVSYEVAMGLAVVSAVLMTSLGGFGMYGVGGDGIGTLSMIEIVKAQEAQHVWFLFKFFPLGLIAFFIFAVAMVAETNRAPFDLPEAESELTAGFHTEYSGFRWSLFMLAEYAAMIAVSSIAVTLWLGGWLRPFPNLLAGSVWDFLFSLFPGLTFLALGAIGFLGFTRMPGHSFFRAQKLGLGGFAGALALIGLLLLGIAVAGYGNQHSRIASLAIGLTAVYWFVAKVAVFMYLYIWYRATFPRYRFDQLMQVGWKVLLPIALGVLIATAALGIALPAIREWLGGHAG